MKRFTFVIFFLLILVFLAKAQFFSDNCSGGKNILPVQDINFCSNSEWVLVFEDNFDGDSLDRGKWIGSSGPGSLKNGTRQCVELMRNAVVENGLLNLIARREQVQEMAILWKDSNAVMDDGLPNYRWYDYTSALIMPIKRYPYGLYEASCKIPAGKGIWPAMWMYGAYEDQNNTTIQQEIDVFEFENDKPKVMNMNVHHDGDVCPQDHRGPDYSKSFHTYGLLWEPYKIEWYVDGELIRRYPRYYQYGSDVGCQLNAWQPYQETPFPKDSMVLFLNIAVDNRSGQKPDGSTPFPVAYQIDWARYYVRKDLLNTEKKSALYSHVYPNPSQGTVTVEINEGVAEKVRIKISSLQLKPIKEQGLNGQISQIDLSFLENGIYILQVENKETYQVDYHKIIISK